MNTEGFTGLNVNKAINDIEKFYNLCSDSKQMLGNSFLHLFYTLHDKWASPNAKKYTTKKITEVEELLDSFGTEYMHICSGAEEAGETLAKANGQSFSKDFRVEPGQQYSHYSFSENNGLYPCEEELNGVSGMDTEGVKIALELFKNESKAAIDSFEYIPDGIAFYDPNGALLQVYSRNVNDFRLKFENVFNQISLDMNGYLETEQNNILLAKQQASDTLSA